MSPADTNGNGNSSNGHHDGPTLSYDFGTPEPLGRGYYRLRIQDRLLPDRILIHELRLANLIDRWTLAERLYPGRDEDDSAFACTQLLDQLASQTVATLQPSDVPLVDYESMLSQPPMDYLIDGLLPRTGLATLTGKWGAGKSFLAVSWAISVGAGTGWLGRGTEHGGVVYVAAEGCRAERLIAHEARFGCARPRLWFRKQALPLADPREVDRFLRQCDNLPNRPKLVILDTWHRCTAGLKENDASDMAVAIQACDRIQKSQDSMVLILHHPGHDQLGSSGQRRGRGSSALDAACDTTLFLEKADGGLKLEVTKQKDGDLPEPVRLRLVAQSPSVVVELDDPQGETDTAVDPDVRIVLEVIRDAVTPPNTTELRAVVKRGRMSSERANEACAAAKTRGLITSTEGKTRAWILSDKGRMALALARSN